MQCLMLGRDFAHSFSPFSLRRADRSQRKQTESSITLHSFNSLTLSDNTSNSIMNHPCLCNTLHPWGFMLFVTQVRILRHRTCACTFTSAPAIVLVRIRSSSINTNFFSQMSRFYEHLSIDALELKEFSSSYHRERDRCVIPTETRRVILWHYSIGRHEDHSSFSSSDGSSVIIKNCSFIG